jgi:two-component system sensor histidine kinase PilS (NtrC family)
VPAVRGSLDQRLRRLLVLRVVMVTTLLLIATYMEALSETQPEAQRQFDPLYAVIVATYALTVAHALALRVMEARAAHVYAQVIGDLLTITALVYVSGTSHRGFMLLYPISVLSGAALLSRRRDGVMFAALATTFYALLVWLVRSGTIAPEGLFDVPFVSLRALAYSVLVTGVSCLTVGVTASFMSESLKSVGERLEEATEQVAGLQELNQLIVSSIHSGLLTADGGGRVLYANEFGAGILRRRVLDLQGRTLREIFGSRLLEPASLEARAANEQLARLELEYAPAPKDVLELGLSISPLAKPGRGYLVVFQDLTEIKRLENEVRVNEKLAAMGEMAATLAHEIRNPLGSISGSAQVLREDSSMSPQQDRLLAIITRESRRLSDTLNRFLFQARGGGRPRQPVDLGPLLEESVTLLNNGPEKSPEHRVVFRVDEGPHVCLADPDGISQVFWNLARNGLEAMPAGGELSVHLGAQGNDLVLTVKDEGVGIRKEEQQRIFEPFRTGRAGGTGLGLAVVYSIVQEHGGDIVVRSAQHRGTEVEVRLPRVPVGVPVPT